MKLSYKEENEDARHQAEGVEEAFQEIIKKVKEFIAKLRF